MAEPPPLDRKRRDRMADVSGSAIYTADPEPPFSGVIDELVYICFRADPEAVRTLLPAGLTPDANGSVIVTFLHNGHGGGHSHTTGGFFSPVINEYPGPDTQESCCFVQGVGSPAMARLFTRHFGPFRNGGAKVEVDGRRIRARMWDDELGELAQVELLLPDGPPSVTTGSDRYLGIDGSGHLASTNAGVVGHFQFCHLVSFEISDTAPPELKALRPREFVFQIYHPLVFCTWAAPERIWTADAPSVSGRAALLDILDRQARAVLIVSEEGHVLHANRHAGQLLATLAPGHANPLRPGSASETARFHAALKLASVARSGQHQARFSLPRRDLSWPLIAEVVPVDPALAGPGTAMVMLSDAMKSAAVEDPAILQLLGLTTAEARIAAAVGSGLPPREAAMRLSLQESTVRSALKLIFDKLGISRQAELVQIVARMTKA